MSRPDAPELVDVIPCDGGWWVLVYPRDVEDRVTRLKVAAWGRFRSPDGGWTVEALVADDPAMLALASTFHGVDRLWHDGESYCDCDADRSELVIDPDWCESCIGAVRHPAT